MPHTSYLIPHTRESSHYDYIIAGAGAAGLSLLVRMITSGKFADKQILLLDKEPKNKNDRTWCFWEKGPGFFESIVYKSWSSLSIHRPGFSKQFDIEPYRYKMIRGIDFYNYCFALITSQKNITVLYGLVKDMYTDENETSLFLGDRKFTADYIFNSIIFDKPPPGKKEIYLLQHFKGWVIETSESIFKEEQATLMDFRVTQGKGTAFVYVMPFSSNSALVEYTMFSEQLLPDSDYDKNLRDYIDNQLHCKQYTITSEEWGIIPMTNHRFSTSKNKIIHMGTVGGQTKASTGYTFRFIQKNAAAIVEALSTGSKQLNQQMSSGKYHFYDSVLLNVLATGKLAGDKIFTRLFQKNHPHTIFQFLDNESTLSQDLKLISTLPTIPFLRAGLQELL
ncbi:MAG: lycopene cyclase family protein [Chitinophagaceae bacterium]